jgi:hypothetical protein
MLQFCRVGLSLGILFFSITIIIIDCWTPISNGLTLYTYWITCQGPLLLVEWSDRTIHMSFHLLSVLNVYRTFQWKSNQELTRNSAERISDGEMTVVQSHNEILSWFHSLGWLFYINIYTGASVVELLRSPTSNHSPLTNLSGSIDFIWGSYQTGLATSNDLFLCPTMPETMHGGTTLARSSQTENLKSRHMTFTVLVQHTIEKIRIHKEPKQ